VIEPFKNMENYIEKVFIATLIILFIEFGLTAYFIHRYSFKFAMRIIIPIDRFIFLLKSVLAEEEIFGENDNYISNTE
jgi:hypothetical protein